MNRTVLVIEDDDSIRESLDEFLTTEGYSVLVAENGQRGIEMLSAPLTVKPSLILLDLTMPVMNGDEFLKAQKQDARWSSIPTVVLTAAGGREKPELANGFVKKPIDLDDLLAVIHKYLG